MTKSQLSLTHVIYIAKSQPNLTYLGWLPMLDNLGYLT
jgi:hypothetical protein